MDQPRPDGKSWIDLVDWEYFYGFRTLRQFGCRCPHPLVGARPQPDKTYKVRCRICNVEEK